MENKIYQGDTLKVLKTFPDGCVDLIVTSPPYNVGIKYDVWNDNLSEKEYYDFTYEWMKLSKRVLKPGGRICINIPIMGNNPNLFYQLKKQLSLPKYLEIISAFFDVRECITWIKSYAEYDENVFCGNNTAWGSWLSPSNPFCRSFSEFILVAHKEYPKLQHKGETDLTKDEFLRWTKNVWFFPSENKRRHPAPFPEELPRRCIKLYSWIGDTVLDLFMGQGTTGVVCKKIKRNFIGIDISKEYCRIAQKRIDNIHPTLF